MESGLSPQDKKDLDKFIKFFALKVRLVLFPMCEEIWKFLSVLSVSSVRFVDLPGDCTSSSWREDLHLLLLITHRL